MMRDLPPRRRTPRSPWSQAIGERLTPTITAFVVVSAFVYAFYALLPSAQLPMLEHLAIGPRIWAGELWQPLTSLFLNTSLVSLILNVIGIWFAGALVERTQGTRRLLLLFLGAGVLANVVFALVSRASHGGGILPGPSLALLAVFVGIGRIYGRAQMQVIGSLFLQARTLALIFVLWGVLACLFDRQWAQLAATLTASAAGYLAAAPGGFSELWAAMKVRRLRRRYRVIEGGAGRPPKKFMN